ncbi:MAG TPA: hypothetical protein VHP36_07120 [Chitinispirillaceae bacterium]|nr:hypothetical protein [Chitinispirillaceae bacterium]
MKRFLVTVSCLLALLINSCAVFVCDREQECEDDDYDTITIITR